MNLQPISIVPIASPLNYFGSRPENTQSVITLIKHAKTTGIKLLRCHELFSGSATFSITAMANQVAQQYFINDALPSLEHFWFAVKSKPNELIEKYNGLLVKFSEASEKEAYYESIQKRFNDVMIEAQNDVEQSARFAFLINHTKDGMPLLDKDNQFVCKLFTDRLTSETDSRFAERVNKVSSLFNSNNVIFTSAKLEDKLHDLEKDLTEEDFLQCDPPYPGMEDAKEAPDSHVYYRSETKSSLHEQIKQMIGIFLDKKVSFHLSYGAQGFDTDKAPINAEAKCVLHLSGTPDGPFGVYADRWFFSSKFEELARVFLKDKIVVLTDDVKTKLTGKSMQEAVVKVKEIIKDKQEKDGLSM